MTKKYSYEEKFKTVDDGENNISLLEKEKDYSNEILKSDETNPFVRAELARQGHNLETLVYDKDWVVRAEVAKQGKLLHILVNDEDWRVRLEVAKHGYGKEILTYDKNYMVRAEVAYQGNSHSILVHDVDSNVRQVVLNHGYGIEILKNDENEKIRLRALELENAETHLIEEKFGTYNGNLFLYVWKDKYEIVSGCHKTDSLDEWYEKYLQRMDYDEFLTMSKEQANELFDKMEKLIETV